MYPLLRLYFLEGIPLCSLVNKCERLEAPADFISRYSSRGKGVSYTAIYHVGPLPCAVQPGCPNWKVFRGISQSLPSLLLVWGVEGDWQRRMYGGELLKRPGPDAGCRALEEKKTCSVRPAKYPTSILCRNTLRLFPPTPMSTSYSLTIQEPE